MIASHSERVSGHRLQLIGPRGNGLFIFADIDCYNSRITCPLNSDFVVPFNDYGSAKVMEVDDERTEIL